MRERQFLSAGFCITDLENSSSTIRLGPQSNMGGHQHKVSEQKVLHDVIIICSRATKGGMKQAE